ncbi:hypothetical protein N825_32895 [Skermanella stibiiresistens SB22]|uniref:Uncharacterized protein n=1 Tax=Skermanella stibiiresistens SB22 TaxID=1385369 RepID=W9H7S0_9PROT|nr:hypothetical protein [Skermanella stibiiresistens]EWY40727.1 hypothetical protein N825_32895 [Skermanella stibiiresistens SB22]
MSITALRQMADTRPRHEPTRQVIAKLLAALEQPAGQDRGLTDAAYEVWYLGDDAACLRLLEALVECPLTPPERQKLDIMLAARHWIDGQIAKMHQPLQKNVPFLSSEPRELEAAFLRSLGRHLVQLINGIRPDRYQGPPGAPRRRIDFIGDSHVLAPANLVQKLGSDLWQVRAHYVPGVKLWHVVREPALRYRIGMENTVAACAGPSGFAVFSVGEIDCRPDAGFYNAVRRGEYGVAAIPAMVDLYLERLEAWRAGGISQIGIWGIPAPREDFLEAVGADKALVRDIVATVNDTLRRGAATRGFVFFDLYALTQRDGFASGGYHIDHAHVGSNVLGALGENRLILGL